VGLRSNGRTQDLKKEKPPEVLTHGLTSMSGGVRRDADHGRAQLQRWIPAMSIGIANDRDRDLLNSGGAVPTATECVGAVEG